MKKRFYVQIICFCGTSIEVEKVLRKSDHHGSSLRIFWETIKPFSIINISFICLSQNFGSNPRIPKKIGYELKIYLIPFTSFPQVFRKKKIFFALISKYPQGQSSGLLHTIGSEKNGKLWEIMQTSLYIKFLSC